MTSWVLLNKVRTIRRLTVLGRRLVKHLRLVWRRNKLCLILMPTLRAESSVQRSLKFASWACLKSASDHVLSILTSAHS